MRNAKLLQQVLQLPGDFVLPQALQFKDRANVVFHGQLPEDRSLLGQIGQTQPGALVHGHMGDLVALQVDPPSVDGDQADHHVKASRLSRPIGPQKADDLAAGDADGNILDDFAGLEALLQVGGGQFSHAHQPCCDGSYLPEAGLAPRDKGAVPSTDPRGWMMARTRS